MSAVMDVWVKIATPTTQSINALKSVGMDTHMLKKDENDKDVFASFDHHIAMKVFDNLITKFATHDSEGKELTSAEFGGGHLMIRFTSEESVALALEKLFDGEDEDGNPIPKSLPAGLKIVDAPGTHVWA